MCSIIIIYAHEHSKLKISAHLVALVALLFSCDLSGFHHWPLPSTLPALFRIRPKTCLVSLETSGLTSQILGLVDRIMM